MKIFFLVTAALFSASTLAVPNCDESVVEIAEELHLDSKKSYDNGSGSKEAITNAELVLLDAKLCSGVIGTEEACAKKIELAKDGYERMKKMAASGFVTDAQINSAFKRWIAIHTSCVLHR